MALFLRLSCLEMLGDMQMLQKLVVERLRDGHERDDRFMLQILLLSAPASYLRSDEPLAAAAFLEHYKDKLGPNYSTFKYVWLLRSVELLMYMGRATEGVALMQSHWPHFRRSLLYASPFVRSGFSLLASRCLLGAYMQTRDRAYRRRAEPLLRKWGREQTLYGACQRGLRGVLYAADGSMHAAILALDEAISDLESKSPVVALIFRRKRYQVAADSLGLARIDDKLRAAGVVNPAHLVKVTCGG
jgi:hypothetical protein